MAIKLVSDDGILIFSIHREYRTTKYGDGILVNTVVKCYNSQTTYDLGLPFNEQNYTFETPVLPDLFTYIYDQLKVKYPGAVDC
jgi:hypothetical protein